MLKVGDMVVLIRVEENSSGYRRGLRVGEVGTVKEKCDGACGYLDCSVLVEFQLVALCHCPLTHLRKIDPPEAADGWKYCVFVPKDITIRQMKEQYEKV